MRDFDEFIRLIDSDTYVSMQFAVNQAMIDSQRFDSFDRGFYTALELLKRYHAWNSESQ